MLKENGAPPTGKWADIAVLEPVRDYKARHASTMLTFDAVVDAIDQIEAKRKQQPISYFAAEAKPPRLARRQIGAVAERLAAASRRAAADSAARRYCRGG